MKDELTKPTYRDEYGKFLQGFVGLEKRYKNPEEMLATASAYLEQVDQDKKAPTMAGMALALGFRSRQALLNYQKAPGYEAFFDVVAYLKLKMEQTIEERLLDPTNKNVAGTIFNMKNNYGCADKTEIAMDSRTVSLTGFAFAPPIDQTKDQ